MPGYRMDWVLTADGWLRDAVVRVSAQGLITAIVSGAAAADADSAGLQSIRGIVIPGIPNAHSHAFQRAMVGASEYRSGAHESFWTWREAMYELANGVEPEELELIAAQLFVEMLKAGYTSVAEFHYLHRRRDGSHYQGGNALWQAVDAAAETAGIALTLLPTLYISSDFGARALLPEQRRFHLAVDEFLRAVAERHGAAPERPCGAALHSLRAVPLENLRNSVAGLRAIEPKIVIHIHVAEQVREVRACLKATGRRPIELLLETGLVDAHWCLVHATHATGAEIRAMAASQANVCVCPSTEGNLGDGFFDAERLLAAGGRLCIGSDSQVTLDPAEELRWLEYQQRIRHHRRAVLVDAAEPHAGARLWREAARSGARALGQNCGVIGPGCRADWLVLEAEHATLAGASGDGVLDRLVFGGARAAIRDVMVGGRWVIENRQHRQEQAVARRFADWMQHRTGSS